MKVPGSNLLKQAQRLVTFPTIVLTQWEKESKSGGIVTPVYFNPIGIQASVQAVSRAMYQQLGLDLQKNYILVYASVAMRDLQRGGACDMVDWNGRRYNVESNTDWFLADGWRGALCVEIGATP